ncbi:hypothetical protein FZC84_00695 [Rossellomorea vietnamensis]|uniref:Uncharacterized protein n=1 Tax=Rossellomorea vietnamensis TaxID=218284 RepID=A0A5D4MJP5_9BACI|nr:MULTISPECIES: hypothetical protein [Bacillaceae]TYS01221.1 hypothetical protein FZC84_00695 [Rossellomorea vietnamensis]
MKQFALYLVPGKDKSPNISVLVKKIEDGYIAEYREVLVLGKDPIEAAEVCYKLLYEDYLDRKKKRGRSE